ncbi:Uncharacterised protein [Kluyvera cryocrescens]|uniref:Uncharacterized protein n=1 Tax=Kluyvera cryocrescens TaxID=580 RepID=A0A485A5M4_KLUCR|nr:Uncharacterised protein [Kluyvera cryocrescens]
MRPRCRTCWTRPLDEIFDLAGDDFTVSWAEGTPDDFHCDEQALAHARAWLKMPMWR